MSSFEGFPEEGLDFLSDLEENNNKEWFEEHKSTYQSQLLEPAQCFVEAMGEALQELSAGIRYDTRTNGSGSLMRIYRDTRFSKSKEPYKTKLAGMFWQGEGKKTLCPGFGFELSVEGVRLMAGMFQFSKEQLARYREAVDDDASGEALVSAWESVQEAGEYSLNGPHYKRTPRGYAKDHPRADFLRFNALYVHPPKALDPEHILEPELVELCAEQFRAMAPIQQWLVEVGMGGA